MIRRTHHTSFTVKDLDRSIAFYRDLLGMEFVGEQGGKVPYLATVTGFPEADLRVAFLKPVPDSEHMIELIQYRHPIGTPADVRTCNPGSAHICFVVDGIHEMHERFVAAGVQFKSAPVEILAGRHKGGYCAYMTDPDGITLELLQLPPHMK
jgi:catechol 2,3-dioxygenase-like lactoylglutathione lyase family enzyme